MSKKVHKITDADMMWANFFTNDMLNEYIQARKKFGPFDNDHEGLAVIWEEFEELKAFVFSKNQSQEEIQNAGKECIQLATMAMAFYVELIVQGESNS